MFKVVKRAIAGAAIAGALLAFSAGGAKAQYNSNSLPLYGSIFNWAMVNATGTGGNNGFMCGQWNDAYQWAYASGNYQGLAGGPLVPGQNYAVNMYSMGLYPPTHYMETVTCTFFAYGGGGPATKVDPTVLKPQTGGRYGSQSGIIGYGYNDFGLIPGLNGSQGQMNTGDSSSARNLN